VLGPNIQLLHSYARSHRPSLRGQKKSPSLPWRQDLAYWDHANLFHAIIVTCSLQDSGGDGSHTLYIPHSHLCDLLPHHKMSNQSITLTTSSKVASSSSFSCPLPCGGVSIHCPKTIYSNTSNNTQSVDYFLILVFGEKFDTPVGNNGNNFG